MKRMAKYEPSNKFATHKTSNEKLYDFMHARANGEIAYKSDGSQVPLKHLSVHSVEFIGGYWRVQNLFHHKIHKIRDKEFVLSSKLERQESVPFEYYYAYTVSENCYGKYLSSKPDIIVAKYTTKDGVYWGYGNTIEQARAFLGIKLFDTYQDVICNAISVNKTENQKK